YASLGVQEYFVYDPLREYLEPPLQGFQLKLGEYRPILESAGTVRSGQLGLDLSLEKAGLVLVDHATGVRLLRPSEEIDRRRDAELRAQHAEAENARLKREVERLKRKGGK